MSETNPILEHFDLVGKEPTIQHEDESPILKHFGLVVPDAPEIPETASPKLREYLLALQKRKLEREGDTSK